MTFLRQGDVRTSVVHGLMLGVGALLSTTLNDPNFGVDEKLSASILAQARREREEADRLMQRAYGNEDLKGAKKESK